MSGMFSIPDSKRKNLNSIAKDLGLTQKALAKAMNISPAMISKYFSSGTNHKGMSPDRIQQLVTVLKERALACQKIKLASIEDHGGWPESLVKHSLEVLGTDTLQNVLNDLSNLAAPEHPDVKEIAAFVLIAPGGALPVHASNYVERAADGEIDGILTAGRSPSSIVVAPINGGTSSFLNRIYQRAQSVPNCWVRIVHLDDAFAGNERFTQLELFGYLFRKIGLPNEAYGRMDVAGMKDAFEHWARDAWRGASRVVLIIDGLDQVFRNPGSIVDAFALVNWLNALRNDAALGQHPYNKLALFVALTGKTWSAAHASPYATQAALLSLKKFTFKEVTLVFEKLGVESNRSVVENVHSFFHGHPYLTQLFVWSLRNGSTYDDAEREALDLEGPYEAHWERLKSEMAFLIGTNYKLSELLTAVVRIVDRSSKRHPLNEKSYRIWGSYSRDLRVFGLLDGTLNEPTICKFYRNAIESESLQTLDGKRK
jgi:transcriptional regulator with XRE-family HTH domain